MQDNIDSSTQNTHSFSSSSRIVQEGDLNFQDKDLAAERTLLKSIEQDKKRQERRSNARFFIAIKVVIIILLIIGVLELLCYKFILPSVSYPLVYVEGVKNYSGEEIVRLLKPLNVNTWYSFSVEQAVSLLASESGIDSVSVKKVFPNKIYIKVHEREAVALTFINIDNSSVPLQIDKSGVLFAEKNPLNTLNMPIISGLPINHLSEGMRIPEKYRSLIEDISAIRALKEDYFNAIAEVCVLPKEYGNYELVIIPAKSHIKIMTDRKLNEDSLKYMMVALDVVSKIDKEATQINIRAGVVSYIK